MENMEEKGVDADVVSCSTVIDAYAKTGDTSGAEWWLRRMEEKGIGADVVSYNTVIDAYVNYVTFFSSYFCHP